MGGCVAARPAHTNYLLQGLFDTLFLIVFKGPVRRPFLFPTVTLFRCVGKPFFAPTRPDFQGLRRLHHPY